MAHNPMVEIVLESALNVLTEAHDVIRDECISIEFQIKRMKDGLQQNDTCLPLEKRLEEYSKLKNAISKVLRQGNSLDI
jgi:hypothetical protein